MKILMDAAKQYGIRANGFWSIHAKQKMSDEQLALRETVLREESFPDTALLKDCSTYERFVMLQSLKEIKRILREGESILEQNNHSVI